MATQPKSHGFRDACIGPLLMLVLAIGVPLAIGTIVPSDDPETAQQAAPTSTTLAADEDARMGCYLWFEAHDPSILTPEEQQAREARALERAANSAAASVAITAQNLQATYENDPPFEQFSAALHDFEAACEAVGERNRYP
jgi:hypothetical protein